MHILEHNYLNSYKPMCEQQSRLRADAERNCCLGKQLTFQSVLEDKWGTLSQTQELLCLQLDKEIVSQHTFYYCL